MVEIVHTDAQIRQNFVCLVFFSFVAFFALCYVPELGVTLRCSRLDNEDSCELVRSSFLKSRVSAVFAPGDFRGAACSAMKSRGGQAGCKLLIRVQKKEKSGAQSKSKKKKGGDDQLEKHKLSVYRYQNNSTAVTDAIITSMNQDMDLLHTNKRKFLAGKDKLKKQQQANDLGGDDAAAEKYYEVYAKHTSTRLEWASRQSKALMYLITIVIFNIILLFISIFVPWSKDWRLLEKDGVGVFPILVQVETYLFGAREYRNGFAMIYYLDKYKSASIEMKEVNNRGWVYGVYWIQLHGKEDVDSTAIGDTVKDESLLKVGVDMLNLYIAKAGEIRSDNDDEDEDPAGLNIDGAHTGHVKKNQ